jgi:hypothetical protein
MTNLVTTTKNNRWDRGADFGIARRIAKLRRRRDHRTRIDPALVASHSRRSGADHAARLPHRQAARRVPHRRQ